MFEHTHPYEPFLFEGVTKLIVGTLPPPRFTTGALLPEDVDFCYGSKNGQLWPILDRIFNLGLVYETTSLAIQQRKEFLLRNKIGVCDIVERAFRQKIDASDLGMSDVTLRNILGYLKDFKNIDTILFMGGNSKNGPEYFFRRHLKENGLALEVVSNVVPRVHQFKLPVYPLNMEGDEGRRTIRTVSLTAPSGAANRAIGSMDRYKRLKDEDPSFTTFDFRVWQYRPFFARD